MKTKRIAIFIMILIVMYTSCSLAENYIIEDEITAFHFNETMVTLSVGGLGYAYITVEPSSALDTDNIQYSVNNESIVTLYETNNNGVVFSGVTAGTTLINAKLQNKTTKIAVIVEE